MVTPEPCVVCDGSGDTMDNCGCCWSACDVCIGSGKRPSLWGWTASLGAENSSEVGTGAKDATGGRRATPTPTRETMKALGLAKTPKRPKPRLCVLGGVNCQSPHAAWVKGEK